MLQDNVRRCDRCGAPQQLVFIHGHQQCAICHQISDGDCCSGETASCLSQPKDHHQKTVDVAPSDRT